MLMSRPFVRLRWPFLGVAVAVVSGGCSLLNNTDVDATSASYGAPVPTAGGASGTAGAAGSAAAGTSGAAGGPLGGAAGASSQGGIGGTASGAAGQAGNGGGAAGASGAGNAGTAGSTAGGSGGVGGGAAGIGGTAQAGASGMPSAGAGGQAGGSTTECNVAEDCPKPPDCRVVACVEQACVQMLAATGTACTDDQNPCNGVEKCDGAGVCSSFDPIVVDDADACTVDSCDTATGAPLHTLAAVDDGEACTVDTCDSTTGISHVPVSTTTCVLTLAACEAGYHAASLTPCAVGDEGCDCAVTTGYRQVCAGDCGVSRTYCLPAAAASCPDGFHREAPLTCCGDDCATYVTAACVANPPTAAPYATCEDACSAGYHPTAYVIGPTSGCESVAPPVSGRMTTCEPDSPNFIQCGTTCPAGYTPKNPSTAAECGPGSPNRIRCQK